MLTTLLHVYISRWITVTPAEEQKPSLIHISEQSLSLTNSLTIYCITSLIPGGQRHCISPAKSWEQVPPFLQESTFDAHAETGVEQFLPER